MDDALTTIFSVLGQSDNIIKGNSTEISTGGSSGDSSVCPLTKKNDVNLCQIKADSRTNDLSDADKRSFFWQLARALYHHQGSDSSLALALVAFGEQHRPDAVRYMVNHADDMEALRKTLGGLLRVASTEAPDDLAVWVAEDREGFACLQTYAERKPAPAYMAWADSMLKFRLDRADLRVIEEIHNSDAIEREAIRQFG